MALSDQLAMSQVKTETLMDDADEPEPLQRTHDQFSPEDSPCHWHGSVANRSSSRTQAGSWNPLTASTVTSDPQTDSDQETEAEPLDLRGTTRLSQPSEEEEEADVKSEPFGFYIDLSCVARDSWARERLCQPTGPRTRGCVLGVKSEPLEPDSDREDSVPSDGSTASTSGHEPLTRSALSAVRPDAAADVRTDPVTANGGDDVHTGAMTDVARRAGSLRVRSESVSGLVRKEEGEAAGDEQGLYADGVGLKTAMTGESDKLQAVQKSFPCEECQKLFSSASCLRKHRTIHTGKKPYTCDACGKEFRWPGDLSRHKKIHIGEKPFACQLCGQTFTRASSLKSHSKIHVGLAVLTCSICSKTFRWAGNLKQHMSIHAGLKPFACDLCDKTFAVATYLKSHRMSHSGEKPFTCDACGKVFRWSGDLSRHKKVHTGEKLFACDLCGQTFTRASGLKSHSKLHAGVNSEHLSLQE